MARRRAASLVNVSLDDGGRIQCSTSNMRVLLEGLSLQNQVLRLSAFQLGPGAQPGSGLPHTIPANNPFVTIAFFHSKGMRHG
jgi:hypothetical protein